MNIFWILEDALRPDHMGCYGYSKNTTPNCDRLAQEGVLFTNVISTAAHTLPPIVSMLMGQTAATHGIINPRRYTMWKYHGLWKDAKTPLHALRDQGHLIDGELVMRWEPLGFTRDTPGEDIEHYFEENLRRRWFFYAEPYPTHLPYDPPEEYYRMFLDQGFMPTRETLERLKVVRNYLIVHPSGVISKIEAGEKDSIPDDRSDTAHKRTVGTVDLKPEDQPAVEALYDGEVRVFDDMVGRWIHKLEDLGLLDDTLVILTADHGEELMERGHVGHSSCNLKGTLYDESIRVPLLLRYPRQLPTGCIIHNQISLIDLMPTIFDLLNIPTPREMEGHTLLPLILGETKYFREEAFAETPPAGWQALENDEREVYCLRTEEWKLIFHTDAGCHLRRYELYNLKSEPDEKTNLFDARQDIVTRFQPRIDEYVQRRQKTLHFK